MIISPNKKFVFVKTTKTAGTSVEIALTKYCDESDVITPIHPDDEAIKRDLGLRGPQNDIHLLPDGRGLKLFNHAPARRAKRAIGPQAWKDWFTFAFERNPYDRVISAFHYRKKNKTAKGDWDETATFADFLEIPDVLERLHMTGWGLYTNNDTIIVDKIYRFEDLNTAMKDIYARLGIDETEPLMKTKVSKRSVEYQDYYTDETRKQVAKAFENEIETFGYKF